jgi:O-acetyl-ADP-ribose deacetylase (regulator of RNase III)
MAFGSGLREGGEMSMLDESQTKGRFVNGRVTVVVGDITLQAVDAIVNAANSSLLGGGGVDGAIHDAGGPRILEECRELRRTRYQQGLPTGEAVITTAGELPARHVIHTVGPIRGVDPAREAEQLAACYRNSLALAVEHGAESIAFPAISTGIYGYPREEAAVIASTTIAAFLAGNDSIREVRMVFYSQKDCDVFLRHHHFEKE